jgi:hypothetical protein
VGRAGTNGHTKDAMVLTSSTKSASLMPNGSKGSCMIAATGAPAPHASLALLDHRQPEMRFWRKRSFAFVTALPARKENMAAMVAAVAAMVATVDPGGFPNDIMGPVRGWRSWNAVFSDVTQEFMTRQVGVVCV